ncbi:MAG: GAF domain-containing protein, partial [Chloroflexi bacterium]|nr:GAF domain-containing protein [Chloroflexota bacterium]
MPPATQSAPAALTQIQGQIAALEQVLRSQHETLRQRGIILPADVLEKLYYAQTDLARLEPHLAGHSAELERLRALAHTTQIVNSSLELDGVLEQVMDTAIALIGAERGFIVLQSSRTGELEFRVARDNQQRTIEPDRFNISRTILTEVARSGQPVIAQDALLDPAYGAKASIAAQATRSILCVPLIFRERVTGVLYADNRRVAGLFGEKELNLLAAFAHQAAIAIENARLYDRARRTLDEITEIKEIMDNVFESIASGVITTNNAHTILTCNRAAGRILNVTPGTIVGRSLQDVFPALFERAHGLIDAVYRDQTPQSMEIEPVMPGRGAVNLRIKLTPLQDVNNITYGLVIVADDLTAIKQREATLSVVRTYLSPRLVRHIQSIDDLGLSGDEREVSIVFADVRGFTTFSEHLPPEELMSVITRYLTVASDAIELHDGIIDKYMGDAV